MVPQIYQTENKENDFLKQINDIVQNVSSTRNDLSITGRDLSKNLKTLISKYTYSYKGPDFFFDDFKNGINNWSMYPSMRWTTNVSAFSNNYWVMTPTIVSPPSPPPVYPGQDFYSIIANTTINGPSSIFSTIVRMPICGVPTNGFGVTIYPYRILTGQYANWLRLLIYVNAGNFAWKVEQCVNGTITQQDGGYKVLTDQAAYPIYVLRYDYTKFCFMIGDPTFSGNSVTQFSNPTFAIVKNGSNGMFDITNPSSGSALQLDKASIGFGCYGYKAEFANAKYIQYSDSLSIQDLMKKIATKAGIFDYKFQYMFEDYLYDPLNWSGIFTIQNRVLSLIYSPPNHYAIRTAIIPSLIGTTNPAQISDSEIEFVAKVIPTDSSLDYGLNFIFRNQRSTDIGDCYKFSVRKQIDYLGNINTSSRFIKSSTDLIASSPETNPIRFNSSNVDITKWHRYKVVFSKGWMFSFIDDSMVSAWLDNNSTETSSIGYIGFEAFSNSTVYVKNIKSSFFWNQIVQYTINTGDDMESSVDALANTIRAWNFSDLFGRFKSILLNESDISSYSYDTQLVTQGVDSSDKEYVNQVTVIGQNVSAVARDSSSIASNSIVRENVIIDYKISTYQQAYDRANYELINFQKFGYQSAIKQINNVGSEVLDVVHVENTGSNSSNYNEDVRVYAQTQSLAGSSNEYSIELETGKKT